MQLSLFDREERAAIIEYDGGTCRQHAERVAGIEYDYTTPAAYLQRLIGDNEPIIHLFGLNPHLILVRSLASYEPEIAKKRAWMKRSAAESVLMGAGYYHHCWLEMGKWKGKTYRKTVE